MIRLSPFPPPFFPLSSLANIECAKPHPNDIKSATEANIGVSRSLDTCTRGSRPLWSLSSLKNDPAETPLRAFSTSSGRRNQQIRMSKDI